MSKKGLLAVVGAGIGAVAYGAYQLFKNRGADEYAELELVDAEDAEIEDDTEESAE